MLTAPAPTRSFGFRNSRRRRGATAVEFALVAPTLFLIFFASVEFSRINLVRHTIDIAAYEGARAGILPGATSADIEAQVNATLSQVAVKNSVVTVSPADLENASRVTVSIATPMNSNGFMFGRFMSNRNLSANSTLAREGYTSPST